MYFVQSGTYYVGYEVNKVQKFRLQFGERTVIAGFNLCFDKRSIFVYRADKEMSCVAIRKKNLMQLFEEFPVFEKQIKLKILNYYDEHLRRPLMKKR